MVVYACVWAKFRKIKLLINENTVGLLAVHGNEELSKAAINRKQVCVGNNLFLVNLFHKGFVALNGQERGDNIAIPKVLDR
jgi:hypothetical protein